MTVLVLAMLPGAACSEHDLAPLPGEAAPGGETTVVDDTKFAFSNRASNLDDERSGEFFVGNSFFKQNWVQAPASTAGRDGLGPTFNARSCSTCHLFDGRGQPPAAGEVMSSMLLRLSVPGSSAQGGPLADPSYGEQLQPFAIDDVPAEGTPTVTYTEVTGRYGDGAAYSLRKPTYSIDALGFGPLAAGVMISPRVAPQMIGMGLLAAIPEADILANADPDDRDGDGIAGRPNYPFDPATGAAGLGRFGWKANQVGVAQQVEGALLGDMGLTSAMHPDDDCPPSQSECAAAIAGDMPEASAQVVEAMVFYTAVLAPPARREVDDPEVLAGRELFDELGCASCHVPSWRTGSDAIDPALTDQLIWPFTDLLLHDMGDELA
ncbi:MAG: thiol oxidoreductase, partial [Deltaproteobacteria bacterium]|nr:thiol oxidoreductase [Nannocystaceae bacterium]